MHGCACLSKSLPRPWPPECMVMYVCPCLCEMCKNCQLTIFWIVFLFSQKTVFDISCKLSPFRDNLHERSNPTFCRKSRRMTTICCLPSLLREHNRLNLKVLLLLLSDWCLTLKAQVTTAADDNCLFIYFFFIFQSENKSWHFMLIVCLADDSHKMLRLVFSENKKTKKKQIWMSSAKKFAWHFKD